MMHVMKIALVACYDLHNSKDQKEARIRGMGWMMNGVDDGGGKVNDVMISER